VIEHGVDNCNIFPPKLQWNYASCYMCIV